MLRSRLRGPGRPSARRRTLTGQANIRGRRPDPTAPWTLAPRKAIMVGGTNQAAIDPGVLRAELGIECFRFAAPMSMGCFHARRRRGVGPRLSDRGIAASRSPSYLRSRRSRTAPATSAWHRARPSGRRPPTQKAKRPPALERRLPRQPKASPAHVRAAQGGPRRGPSTAFPRFRRTVPRGSISAPCRPERKRFIGAPWHGFTGTEGT